MVVKEESLDKIYLIDSSFKNFNNEWYVFGKTNPIANSILIDSKKRNTELANVKNIRIHDFKHSCASLLIDSGAKLL